MNNAFTLTAMALLLTAALPDAWSADAGAPVLPRDHSGKTHWEVVFDSMSRDLDEPKGPLSVGDTFEADALYLRFHTDIGQAASLDFDAGALNADEADTSFYGGVGLRLLAYDSEAWRVGAHLQVHYAPGVEAERSGQGIVAGRTRLDYDLLEVDGGVTLAAKLKLADDLTVMPYVGPVFSVLNLDGDAEASGAREGIDASEDNVIGAMAGIALVLPEGNTLRIEARAFDSVSVSAAAGIVF